MFPSRLADSLAGPCGLTPGERLVVAASGGVDSTVLFRSLRELGVDAAAVYVHHGLRAAADDEAAFVTAMAAEAGAEALVVPAPVGEGNVQDAAREARYSALADAARHLGCTAVATGHTATDQAETVLMALVRGAGLRGLGGMAPWRPLERHGEMPLVRPLLWAARTEVEAEARARGWAWRDDASNATDAYRRNRIRHHVLPLLEAEGGAETAARIAAAAAEARAVLDAGPAAGLALGAGAVPLNALRELSEVAVRTVLAEAHRAFAPEAPRSRAIVGRLVRLVEAPAGQRVGLGAVTVWRDRDRLRWVHTAPPADAVSVESGVTEMPVGRLFRTPLLAVPQVFGGSALTEVVDAEALAPPLVLRPWRAGDRLTPVGGHGRLVADLLSGVPPSERAEALVLTSGEGGRLVWLVGHRLAAHAAVTASTVRAERLDWCPARGAVAGSGAGR